MANNLDIMEAAFKLNSELQSIAGPPEEGLLANSQQVLNMVLVANTRPYIIKIANQINGTYEMGWYDGCAVMIRRLVETLLIECFEAHNIKANIQDSRGDYFMMRDLVTATLNQTEFVLSRNGKKSLPRFKDTGDKSAHSRFYTAIKSDIEPLRPDLRLLVQELLNHSKLKN